MGGKTVRAQPVTQMFGHLGRAKAGRTETETYQIVSGGKKCFMGKIVNYILKKFDSMTSTKKK